MRRVEKFANVESVVQEPQTNEDSQHHGKVDHPAQLPPNSPDVAGLRQEGKKDPAKPFDTIPDPPKDEHDLSEYDWRRADQPAIIALTAGPERKRRRG